jgi:hypothetical protein
LAEDNVINQKMMVRNPLRCSSKRGGPQSINGAQSDGRIRGSWRWADFMCLCVVFRGVVFRPQVMLMRKLGYEIQIASNGRECLEVLEREAARGRQHEIQCILMDASMVRTHEDTGKSRQGTGKDGLQCVMPVANWLMVLLFAHLLFFFSSGRDGWHGMHARDPCATVAHAYQAVHHCPNGQRDR